MEEFTQDEKVKAVKWGAMITVSIIIIIAIIILWHNLFATVESGTYHITQAAITGHMDAKMDPGMYLLNFGHKEIWPTATTFYFTKDKEEGDARDQSINVTFRDGSKCDVSGTIRVQLPAVKDEAVGLTTKRGFRTLRELNAGLLLPHLRNIINLTANLMTAQESYSSRRNEFIQVAWDQIQNGMFQTDTEWGVVEDLLTKEKTRKQVQVIKKDLEGKPVRYQNPLHGTGIILSSFEVKKFVYDPVVEKQIASQQAALMEVETSKAQLQKAEQQKQTVAAEGQAAVMVAKYKEEEQKIRAVVVAQRDKEVLELNAERDKKVAEISAERDKQAEMIQAQKRLSVAQLDKDAAELQKQQNILIGQGEAERKRLIMAADGALQPKLEAYTKVMSLWAEAYAKRHVPNTVIGGGNAANQDGMAVNFQDTLSLLALKNLGLDMSMGGAPKK
jgi:regulator of protease activity HflC (stomatin/prohibitin superfamily)